MSIEAVDYVFTRLAAEYGAAWDRSFGQAPIGDVKTVWADRLSDFTHSDAAKKSILWALKNLPDRCPNAIEFRNLCRQAPVQDMPALPEPKADPDRVREELAKLGPLREKMTAPKSSHNPREWANRILERHKSGEKISPTVVQMARQGLGMEA